VISDNQLQKGKTKFDLFTLLFALAGGALLIFIIMPILSTLLSVEVQSLWQTLLDRETKDSLWLTFYSAAWATLLAIVTGVPLAYILARFPFKGKQWVQGLINLPIVIPHTAAGIALLMVFGRQTFIGALLGKVGISFVDRVPGIVVGMLFVSLPYLVNGSRFTAGLARHRSQRTYDVGAGDQRIRRDHHPCLPPQNHPCFGLRAI